MVCLDIAGLHIAYTGPGDNCWASRPGAADSDLLQVVSGSLRHSHTMHINNHQHTIDFQELPDFQVCHVCWPQCLLYSTSKSSSPVGKHLRNDEATETQQCKCKVCPESIHPGEVGSIVCCLVIIVHIRVNVGHSSFQCG